MFKISRLIFLLMTSFFFLQLIIEHSAPKSSKLGISFADTLLGAMLNLSCLPKSVDSLVEYFEKPLEGVSIS